MIDRDEIDATSRLLGVHTSDVQRDYVYGWLLAGLYGDNPLMRDRLVLKGATHSGKRPGFSTAQGYAGPGACHQAVFRAPGEPQINPDAAEHSVRAPRPDT